MHLFRVTLFAIVTPCALLADRPFDGAFLRLYKDASLDGQTHIQGALTDRDGLRLRLDAITLTGDLSNLTSDLALPARSGDGYAFRWWSSDAEHLTSTGKVTRPRSSLGPATVLLKVFARKGDTEIDRSFTITIPEETASAPSTPKPALAPVTLAADLVPLVESHWTTAYSPISTPRQSFDFTVSVAPGESIQAAIDLVGKRGGGIVALASGIHPLTSPLTLCDRLTLVGAGRDYTVIRKTADFPGASLRNPKGALSDVVLKDFTIDGDGRPGNGVEISSGIDDPAKQGGRILLQNLVVRDVFDHGVHIKRVSDLLFDRVRINNCGNHSELHHNSYLLGINRLLITDSDFSSPVGGKCLKLTRVVDGILQRTRFADGLLNGIQIDDASRRIALHDCRFEHLGRTALWVICERFGPTATRYTTDPAYAPQQLLVHRCTVTDNTRGAVLKDIRDVTILESTFRNREHDIITLRSASELKLDAATRLAKPPLHAQVPEDVPIL
ncbi:MAG: right-handed parallel beta-helix repeat-containing protein [Opitutaceae bacterium]|jgi:hypothetical protein|nr:right-handed parallel beta-helix repeat-containing protein [Opitutaceae bacterium]